MATGWKQVWEDIRNALRGGAAPPEEAPPPGAPPAPVELVEPPEAAIAAAEVVEPAEHVSAGIALSMPAERTDPSLGAGAPPEAPTAPIAAESPPAAEIAPHERTPSDAPDKATASDASTPSELAVLSAGDAAAPSDSAVSVEATAAPAPQPAPFWRRPAWSVLIVLLASAALVNAFFRFGGPRLWAQWTASKPPAPDIIATFDGGTITVADLEAHFRALVPEEYRQELRSLETLRLVIQEMVTDELARRWATERKVDADETFQHTMEHITENVNLDTFSGKLHEGGVPVAESEIQAYYEKNKTEFGDQPLSAVREQIRQRLVGEREGQYMKDYIDQLKSNASISRDFGLLDVPEPTDAELRTYYETNTQNYTVTAQFTVDMLTVPIGPDESARRTAADTALLKLRSGESLGAVSAQVPEAQVITGTVVPAGRLGAEWDAAVKGLQPDELSDIISTGDALYIVRLIQARPERTLTFEEVRPEVLETVRQQRTEQWMKENGAKTLFTLKSKQYTLSQFYKEYQELPPGAQAQFVGPQGMRDLADRLIERLLIVEDTYDQLFQVQNKELIDETRLRILKQMMEQQEVDDKIQVTDEEIRQYYDQNQNLLTPPPQIRIRYIRIGLGQTEDEKKAVRARADEAFKKLVPGLFQQGAEFATVAKEYSEDPETAAQGGELPFPIGETNDPFEPPELHELHEIVLSLPVNQISMPFELGGSMYIVQPIERTQPPTLTFEESEPYIKESLTKRKHDETLRQLQDRLAKQANLVVYDSALQAYYARTSGGEANATPQPTSP